MVRISIFGESHGIAIGVVIDGLPAGEPVDMDAVLAQMKRRAQVRDPAQGERFSKGDERSSQPHHNRRSALRRN